MALIGRAAVETTCIRGGSAQVNPPYQVSVADGLLEALGDRVGVHDGPTVRQRSVAALGDFVRHPRTGEPGMQVTYEDADGQEMRSFATTTPSLSIGWDDGLGDTLPARAVLEVELQNEAGPVEVGGIGAGGWELEAGDRMITADLDLEGVDPGEAMLRPPSFSEVVDCPPAPG